MKQQVDLQIDSYTQLFKEAFKKIKGTKEKKESEETNNKEVEDRSKLIETLKTNLNKYLC